MKRIAIFTVIIIILLCLCSCASDKEAVIIEQNGYFMYETHNRSDYLAFLANMDTNKYEIIDISVSYRGETVGNDYMNHYAITYKSIENVEEP